MHAKWFLALFAFICLTTAVVNISGVSSPKPVAPPVLGEQTSTAEIAFWESFLSTNPTYIEGWLELARVLNSAGDLNYAEGAYQTAKAINPNHPSVVTFP